MIKTLEKIDLIIYGIGSRGKSVVDALIYNNVYPSLIIDKYSTEISYKGINILPLEKVIPSNLNQAAKCIVTLHNNFVNIDCVYQELFSKGFSNIYSLKQALVYYPFLEIDNGYWLSKDFQYGSYNAEINLLRSLFSDSKSTLLLDSIIKYRDFGDMNICPNGSLEDEYTPTDLPKFENPLRLIDCGSYDGAAIRKFLNAGYEIETLIAFEPDPLNFEHLSKKMLNLKNSFFLPLGVWSSNTQLRFSGSKNMGSSLDENGEMIIQCVRIDSLIHGFLPNLIKFDVEGAEVEALIGCRNLITKSKPDLCISLYHRPEHLFQIPLMIHSWCLDYKFYMRVHEENTFGVVLYCYSN